MEKFSLRLYNTETAKILTRQDFFENLQVSLSHLDMNSLDFGNLKTCFVELLNGVAPIKTTFLRANYSQFVTKDVSMAIMLRTKLINQFLKNRTLQTKTKYNNQRNICVSLVKKAKRNYYENLDLKGINDNKKIWTTVKPLFSNKIKSAENIF